METPLKTMKFRLFPDETQKLELQKMLNQFRWYYNAMLAIFNKNMKIL